MGRRGAPIAERVGRSRYVRLKGGLSPRDRRMDHSRNRPAKARTAPAIAYINMFTDKPIATSETPKKIIQIAPIIHTMRSLPSTFASADDLSTACTKGSVTKRPSKYSLV